MEIQGVTESVAHQLRSEIISGELSPGSRLNEIDLAARLGISRPPLREAFRKLESENLVISIPRKGSYVTPMSPEDCIQIYRARIMLECSAVEIIGERGITDLSNLHQTLEAKERFLPPGVPRLKDQPDDSVFLCDFHDRLVKACGNHWIIHYYYQLCPTMARYQMMYLRLPGAEQIVRVEHEEVLACIRQGHYAEAQQKLTAHILKTRDAILQGITAAHPAA